MQDSEGKRMIKKKNEWIDRASDEVRQSRGGGKASGNYAIRIRGHLNQRCMAWFDGFTLDLLENGESLLSGHLEDQAALHGVLERIRDLNLTLLTVAQVDAECQESLSEEG
jgi:hypothetical protein